MASRREDHQDAEQARARRRLEELGRRWPTNPVVYLVAVIVAVLVIVVLAM